jgi:general secretion pathway protein H
MNTFDGAGRRLITFFPRTKYSGFTLIELLVVVFIIGLLASLTVLSINIGVDPKFEQEAKRVAAILRLANEEAIMNATDYVMRLGKTGYDFAQFTADGKIEPLEETDGVFRARELPDGILLSAMISGEEVPLSVEISEESPAIYVLSSGEMTPFQVIVENEDETVKYEVMGDFTGLVEFTGRIR